MNPTHPTNGAHQATVTSTAALVGSGSLNDLLFDGYKYMFVSNSDNLGATLDLKMQASMHEHGTVKQQC